MKRDPATMSLWLKRMRSIKHTARGGWYLDDDFQDKARRRVERFLRNHPGAGIPSHIAEKGMRT